MRGMRGMRGMGGMGGMFAAPWLDDMRRGDFGDRFAFAHKVKTDLLSAAGRGRRPKPGLRFGHVISSSAASAGATAGIAFHTGAVPEQGEIAAGTAGVALIALEPGFGGALGVGIALGPRYRRRRRGVRREARFERRHR